ncbi:MAG: substrate-binding domain-containing protein [Ruminococcus sp.]|nr:substrate-binding domain-containing protein [Ruminococcus sp.]
MKKRPLICVVAADCSRDRTSCGTVNGIIRQAEVCGCDVAVLTSLCSFAPPGKSGHREQEKRIYDLILSPAFDGYIYCRSSSEMDQSLISSTEALLRSTNRFVMAADGSEGETFDYTRSDDSDSFKSIVDHLIEVHGYRRIFCLTGPKGQFQSEERLKGYLRSMREHGLPCVQENYSYGDFWKTSPAELAGRILSGELERPEAVACGNDIMAYTLIEELERAGIRVPEDIAVTGYDGIEYGERLHVILTGYRRDTFRLGADCMRRLYRFITGRSGRRVAGRGNGFIQGTSCGCSRCCGINGKQLRQERVSRRFSAEMKSSDMLYSLIAAEDRDDLFRRTDNYTYLIYRMRHLGIFLTEACLEGGELTFGCDTMLYPAYRKDAGRPAVTGGGYFPAYDISCMFSPGTGKPAAYYISPLHIGDRFFGVAALSFGKEQYGFDDCYRQFVSSLSLALDRIMLRERKSGTEVQSHTDSFTGLPDAGSLAGYIRSLETGKQYIMVCCEAGDLHQLYEKYGGSRTASMIRDLAERISQNLREEEFCCAFTAGSFGIVLESGLRAAELFEELRRTAPASQSAPLGFTFGEYAFYPESVSGGDGIWDIIGAAAAAPARTYRFRNTGTRALYERLSELRSEMERYPERQWNTEDICASLRISKSTLQKNYRSYFGRTVIDELIDFRMERAKRLLRETELSVAEIAAQCGYSTDSYFMKQFKKSFSVTPTEYRNTK